MASPTKVLFLGMDAGDKFLIQTWAADGTLKTFHTLLAEGLVGDTMSIEGFFEGSTWPSFYTGVTPAHHGFHRLIQLNPGTYEFYRCHPGDVITHEAFWNYLSRTGRKVAVLDIPLSSISKKINGIQMVEWGSHDPSYGFCTWPQELKREVVAQFGYHPLRKSCDSFRRTPRQFAVFRNRLIEGVQRKARLTNYFLRRDNWDFFAQVFTEGHCVGHQCWHLHDTRHPSYDPRTFSRTGDPIREVYRAIDAAIGEILTQIDKDTLVVFLASHRMAHNFGAQFLLRDILIRLQVTETCSANVLPGKSPDLRDGLDRVLRWSWRRTPTGVQQKLMPIGNRLRGWIDNHGGRLPSPISGIDLRKSKCFPLDNGLSVGGIRVNIAGREPNGIIKPGAELDAFCVDLAQNLLKLVDYDTGIPIIKSVKRTAELYEGECLDHLPDLLVEWSDEKLLGSAGVRNPYGSKVRLTSEKTGMLEGVNSYCRTGDHRPEGLFIAFGAGIEAGRLERTVSLMDFAPTFCDLLAVRLPHADGEPITEILDACRKRGIPNPA